jgi:hypothetical protein
MLSYLDNVERYAKPNFVPTNEDVLKVRQKTSGLPFIHPRCSPMPSVRRLTCCLGILETVFDTDGLEITLVDVGGPHSSLSLILNASLFYS